MSGVRVVSFGGGVQSTALLVLAARHKIDFRTFLFANVGDDSENPDTLTYVEAYAKPFAESHGIELAEVRWVGRDGTPRSLYRDLLRARRSIDIPIRLRSGAFGNRKCTARYKIEQVAKEAARRGATITEPALVALGITTDEIERASPGVPKQQPWTCKTYPLLDLGLSRKDAAALIVDAGLPVPPKSSCWFCPFQGVEQWRERRRSHPGLFAQACDLEATLNERRAALGRDRIGLLSAHEPLSGLSDQLSFDGACDSGWCMT